jgi:hypothetical protein
LANCWSVGRPNGRMLGEFLCLIFIIAHLLEEEEEEEEEERV